MGIRQDVETDYLQTERPVGARTPAGRCDDQIFAFVTMIV